MDDKAVLVDTNVLLSATAPFRPLHRAALVVLNDWPNQGIALAASTQVFREYLVVATRPLEVNDLGLGVKDALANIGPSGAACASSRKANRPGLGCEA
jgi:predicted nucleic acid-binding protein